MYSRSEEGWITNGLLVMGALGTLTAVGGWLLQDLMLLLAFIAGAGWALSIALLVMLRRSWREFRAKEVELADTRRQAREWQTVAENNSDSLKRFVAHSFPVPRVHPRRTSPSEAEAADAAYEETEE